MANKRYNSGNGRKVTIPGSDHAHDSDCTVGEDGCCEDCGVSHGDPCDECDGRGFHNDGCSEIDA